MYGYQRPINGVLKVNGYEGAKAYQLPPGSSMPLFAADDDVFYIKETDSGGYPSIRAFRFEEISIESKLAFVTREEFDRLKEMLEDAQQHIREKESEAK